MIFREMEYKPERDFKQVSLLAEGRHLGYHWVVLSFETHPCAYVQIRNPEHPYYHKQYDDIELDLRGTLSYSRRYLKIPDPKDSSIIVQDNEGWWIGWDYMRNYFYGDGHKNPNLPRITVKEIIEEVMSVIVQLETKIEWKDNFRPWTKAGDYERDKARGIIVPNQEKGTDE